MGQVQIPSVRCEGTLGVLAYVGIFTHAPPPLPLLSLSMVCVPLFCEHGVVLLFSLTFCYRTIPHHLSEVSIMGSLRTTGVDPRLFHTEWWG